MRDEDGKKVLDMCEELKIDDVVSSFLVGIKQSWQLDSFFEHVLCFYGFTRHENLVNLYCLGMKFELGFMTRHLRNDFPLLQYRVQKEKRKALYDSTVGIHGLSGDIIDLIMTFDNEKEEEYNGFIPTPTARPPQF